MMDLSKFLTPSDDEENENEEKLYDTVENVRQQVEEHLKKEQEPDIPSTSAQINADPETDIPSTSAQINADPETESWDDDDDDSCPLPDEDENKSRHDSHLTKQQLITGSEPFGTHNLKDKDIKSSRTTSPLTISAKDETVCPNAEGFMTQFKSPLKSPLKSLSKSPLKSLSKSPLKSHSKSPLKLPVKTFNEENSAHVVEAQNPRSRLESTMTHDSLENRSITTPPLTDSAKEAADDDLKIVEKTDPFLRNKASHALIEQPMSLDSKEAIAANSNAKRRGSRKSRSLRSTHLAMMSRPLVTSMIAGDDEMLDKSSSSESSLLGKILQRGLSLMSQRKPLRRPRLGAVF